MNEQNTDLRAASVWTIGAIGAAAVLLGLGLVAFGSVDLGLTMATALSCSVLGAIILVEKITARTEGPMFERRQRVLLVAGIAYGFVVIPVIIALAIRAVPALVLIAMVTPTIVLAGYAFASLVRRS